MKSITRLDKPEQFKTVYAQGITKVDRFLVLKAMPNHLEQYRYGISISKRVGKAVVRNRIKRRLKEILRSGPPAIGWDMVFIVRNPAAESEYKQLSQSVSILLSRANISVK
ncbi:MAG: ribonuclease P protein component [Dehalococcoidales bacterium]|nr:ribonuclease P protein component [Dehalococcoidales bacterium]